ncbi:MAG: peptide deformylase [Pseudomonadota bacterium]|jgi:peptide deformylase|nr:peptide deformylase [Pseudomonadota bacterium]QKK05339.1 MAG: peptide deformylase [Pseudomonadota bacterium]|tara:strand:- start:844 stop:1389 length:546 start_codon:yes stop_codon:yes gene_type:complete
MTILKIYTAPDPVLKRVASPVDKVDDALRRQMDDMLETMYDDDGIGLAAPQVGISNRVLVIDLEQKDGAGLGKKGNPLYFVNPEITWFSEEHAVYNEGCLSVPEMYAEVERPAKIRVKYLDYNGKEQELEADGLLATCLQHEVDHLDGILFIDHLSALKRNIILRKLKKLTKLSEAEAVPV